MFLPSVVLVFNDVEDQEFQLFPYGPLRLSKDFAPVPKMTVGESLIIGTGRVYEITKVVHQVKEIEDTGNGGYYSYSMTVYFLRRVKT